MQQSGTPTHTHAERETVAYRHRGRSLVLWPSPLPSPAHGVRWLGCSIKSHIQLVVKGVQIHPRVRRSVRKRNQRSSDRISQPSKSNDVINTTDARALAHGRQRQYAERRMHTGPPMPWMHARQHKTATVAKDRSGLSTLYDTCVLN